MLLNYIYEKRRVMVCPNQSAYLETIVLVLSLIFVN